MTENACYRCGFAMAPEFSSAFALWCYCPDRLKAPCVSRCDFFVSVAGTDSKERE